MALIKTTQNKRIDIKADGFIIDTSTEQVEDNGVVKAEKNVANTPNFPSNFPTERQEIQDIATTIQSDLIANPLPIIPESGLFETEEIQIEVLEDKQMQVRKATVIYEDGIEIGKTYHRHVVDVGEDISDAYRLANNLPLESPRVQAIAGVVHTAQAISDRQAFLASQ